MARIIDLSGRRYGRLVAHAFAGTNRHRAAMWNCVCDCGESVVVCSNDLRKGHSTSCGCWKREQAASINRTHGLARRGGATTYTYRIWKGMRSRCMRVNAPLYERYGGAGIKVCERWDHYASFVADMGEVERGMTLDRIDPAGDYCPENCRWTDATGQARNRRKPSTNTSGIKNVFWKRGGWSVEVAAGKRRYCRGPFPTKEQAAQVAIQLRQVAHGEFANHA